jgi:hypothetical protein
MTDQLALASVTPEAPESEPPDPALAAVRDFSQAIRGFHEAAEAECEGEARGE